MTNRPLLTAALLLALAGLPQGARGASAPPPPDRVQALEAQVRQLQATVEALRRDLDAARQQLAADATASFDARLAALEAQLAELRQQLQSEAAERQRVADQAAQVAEAESRRTSLNVYGDFAAVGYQGQDAVFDAKAFELVVSGRPHARLGFFAEVEFERVAGVGGERGGEIVVEQAYANLVFNPALNLRAGVLLVPFGNVNIDHYAPQRDVISKPLTSYVIAPSDWTDNGLGFYGRFSLGEAWRLSYETYAVAGLSSQIDTTGTRAARQGYGVDNNSDKALVGRAALNRLGGLELGLSGYTGKYDDANRQRLDGWAADGLFRAGPLKLTGEYNWMRAGRDPRRDTLMRGFYARAVLGFGRHLLPRPLTRDFSLPEWAAVVQYDEVTIEGSADRAAVRNRERRTTFGLNYRPTPQWVLKLNYELNDALGQPLYAGDADGWLGSIGFVF